MPSRIVPPLRRSLGAKAYFGLGVTTMAVVVGVAAVGPGSNRKIADFIPSSGKATWTSMLGQRSPGTRTTAVLTKAKGKKVAAQPRARALGKIRRPELPAAFLRALVPGPEFSGVEAPGVLLNPIVGAPLPQLALLSEAPFSVVGGGPSPPGIGAPGGGISVTTPGGGGGGGGSPPEGSLPVTAPTVVVPTPVQAIPEPGTWAMMLLGFAFLGRSLRKRAALAVGACAIG